MKDDCKKFWIFYCKNEEKADVNIYHMVLKLFVTTWSIFCDDTNVKETIYQGHNEFWKKINIMYSKNLLGHVDISFYDIVKFQIVM